VILEACVDSVESALAAEAGGADRLELCDDLLEGGTTPSAGMLAVCRGRVRLPLHVLIRPRGGDFLYSDVETEVMRRDVLAAKAAGADGVVLGALRADGTVDAERVALLAAAARPLDVTFHRAIDVCRDAAEALETLVALGLDRVLTSGQAPTALEGADAIASLVRRAAGRIAILAGGAIDESNVREIVARTGATEVHVRGTRVVESEMSFRNPRVRFRKTAVGAEEERSVTDTGRIRELRALLG
jgi:copper homeostasis protein